MEQKSGDNEGSSLTGMKWIACQFIDCKTEKAVLVNVMLLWCTAIMIGMYQIHNIGDIIFSTY